MRSARSRIIWWRDDETLNIYARSVDYTGDNYEQSDSGVDLNIISDDEIRTFITVLGGNNQREDNTVMVRVELSRVLPANAPTNAVQLLFTLNGSVSTVDITEDLRNSTQVDVPFNPTNDDIPGPTRLVNLRVKDAYYEPLLRLSGAESSFRVVDDDQPPVVRVEPYWTTNVEEGVGDHMLVRLVNAPRGGATRDITVHLAIGSHSTASETDYRYPSSVTIRQGSTTDPFKVWAIGDDIVEDDEILNVYVSSVDFAGQNYEQSDSGTDMTIVNVEIKLPPVVKIWSTRVTYENPEAVWSGRVTAELVDAPPGGAIHDVTVHLAIGSGTTASASEYRYPRSVTIRKGSSRALFRVTAVDDDLPEYDETIHIYVSSVDYKGQNYEQSNSGTYLTIVDNDLPPIVTVRPVSSSTVNEGETTRLQLELTNAPKYGSPEIMTVHLAIRRGTTASESDYSYPRSVKILQAQKRVQFDVRTFEDNLVEG